MCDTFAFFSKTNKQHSFFAKNSDRDPGEPQIIELVHNARQNFKTDFLSEKLSKYTDGPLIKLKEIFNQFEHPYAAFISRPLWIWGAEMGINEKGVSIGNEAVFSKQKLIKNGLLGMDILRLALHNSANADEAAKFIINLLEKYGQGGNGSYSGTLKYHNSFLIKDSNKAIVLESSGKNWAKKDVSNFASISNTYTLTNDYHAASKELDGKNLKKELESKFYTFFAQGNFRKNYTNEQIKNQDKNLNQVFLTLRSHINTENKLSKGMKSICVHPGTLVKSETTSSMVIDYRADKQIMWHTSSPNPCVSIYKPAIISNNNQYFSLFQSTKESEEYFIENRKISAYFLKYNKFFNEKIKTLRDNLELEFQNIIYTDIETKTEKQLIDDCKLCYQKEAEYKSIIKKLIETKNA